MNAVAEMERIADDTAQVSIPKLRAHRGEYLAFRLGEEHYAIEILRVQEIRSYEPPTRIAGAPPGVKGVVNLRGVIVPVVDLRARLGMPATEPGPTTVVIVLGLRDRVIGAIVDAVSEVVEVTDDELKAPPPLGSAVNDGHMTGLACIDDAQASKTIVLLDIEALLGDALAVG